MARGGWSRIGLAAWVVCSGCESPPWPEGADRWTKYAAIVAAEDARGATSLTPLYARLEDVDPTVRAWAARGLGRLEDPDQLEYLIPLLADPEAAVRVASAHAVAQAAHRTGKPRAFAALRAAFTGESDLVAHGQLAYAAARTAETDPTRTAAEAMLVEVAGAGAMSLGTPEWVEARVAMARGFSHLARTSPDSWTFSEFGIQVATAHAVSTNPRDEPGRIRVRRLTLGALVAKDHLTAGLLNQALSDPDPGVRRAAVGALRPEGRLPDWNARLLAMVGDPDETVRIEVLRGIARWAWAQGGCQAAIEALLDPSTRVALAAVDLLAGPCEDEAAQVAAILRGLSASVDPVDWHRAAHALTSLAHVAPEEVRLRLADLVRHPNPFFRMYVARAAVTVANVEILRELAGDDHANVRTEAVIGLGALVGHDAEDVYLFQLTENDPQLVMTASRLLEDSPASQRLVDALVAALLRFSDQRRETSRDVRVGLLETLQQMSPETAVPTDVLRPLLADFDPRVAELVADLVGEAEGRSVEARPEAPEPLPTPTAEQLEAMSRQSVVLTMARGGEIEIRLRPELAATNAWRFARLTAEGYFDGLTFHRVATNFVIQGGSPGANEYWGAGPFTRDEVDVQAHWEGTVGLSTRGRDSGDGQIFVNLVDNLRLDHDYTIFGEVVRGMDVVRRVLESDVIERARVVDRDG